MFTVDRVTQDDQIEIILQTCRPRVLACLQSRLHDLALAEDLLQDASLKAWEHWRRDGLVDHPLAWLLKTAQRLAIDRFRRDGRLLDYQQQVQALTDADQQISDSVDQDIPDDRLRLIFICCHPALNEQVRVALTLTTFCHMPVRQVARALLVNEATLAQRLVRGKRKIRDAGIAFQTPGPEQWPERLSSVLASLYLIFNAGHLPESVQEPVNSSLCDQAVSLALMLVELIPDDPEVRGLAALLLLVDARRPARHDAQGAYISLGQQDRTLWNTERIEVGQSHLDQALVHRRPGPYQLQAAIASLHAQADNVETSDWLQITLLYQRLYRLQPSAVIALNGIMAASHLRTAEQTLAELERLNAEQDLSRFQPLYAARADVLRQLNQLDDSAQAYAQAIALSHNDTERRWLRQQCEQMLERASH